MTFFCLYSPYYRLGIENDAKQALNMVVYGCIPVYYCNLCIFIETVYVFLLLSMYSYCSSMYSYCCLCILMVVHVFLDAATLT